MIYIILVISYITSVLSVAKRATEDLKCIKMNVWQSLSSSTKTISSPSSCTSISKNCCYINMTYSYINFDVSSQYCFSLSGNLNDFKEYINNLYQDDILYFTNYTQKTTNASKLPLKQTIAHTYRITVDSSTKAVPAFQRRTRITFLTSFSLSIATTQAITAIRQIAVVNA